jgi:hypothetical protein
VEGKASTTSSWWHIANKNYNQNVMRRQCDSFILYNMHHDFTSLYLHVTALHTVFVCVELAAMLSTKKDKQHVCVYHDHEWKFVVFYLLARPKVKQDTLVVADGVKHVYNAICSSPHRTRQGRPRRYFRGRTAAQSSYPSFLFLYRLLNAATGWPIRGWYRDGRKSWR